MIWEDMGTVIGKGFQTQLRSSSNLIIDSWLNWTFRKLIYRRKIAVLLSQTSMFAGWWGLPTPLKNHGVSSSVGMMTDIPNMMGKSSWNSMVPVTTNQMMYSQSTSQQVCPFQNIGIWDLGGSQIWPTWWRRRHPIDISEWYLGVTTKGFVTIVARDARDVHRNHCMLLYMIYVTGVVKLKLRCLPWIISHVVLLKSPNCGT